MNLNYSMFGKGLSAAAGAEPERAGDPDGAERELLPGAAGAGDRPAPRARDHAAGGDAPRHHGKAHVRQRLFRAVSAAARLTGKH